MLLSVTLIKQLAFQEEEKPLLCKEGGGEVETPDANLL